ncbi:hypothetical protein TWF730_010873 [Orbilia blumenaviensis]|uniref:Uncharacterized protein n=1 Tax=Orbilia blumenaviensis TaxID=1796055 RepID=A0AAV9UMI4_9PEZI
MASPSPIASPHLHHMQIDSPPALLHHGHPQAGQQGTSSLSKRDKRRTAIANALGELNNNFTLSKDDRYRTQLSILNAEMRAIAETNCHPDTNGILPDFGGEVDAAIDEVLKSSGVILPSTAEKAGRFYSRFIDKVNDSVEQRDVEMTELNMFHERREKTIKMHHELALYHAEQEYQHLVGNIRQRLLTRLQQNRKKLISDKDNLDSTEPSFAFLHPAHYTNLQHEKPPAGRLTDIYTSLDGAPTRKLRGRRGEDHNGDSKSGDLLTILQTLESSGGLPSNGGVHGAQSPGGLGKRKRQNHRKGAAARERETDDILFGSFNDISRPSTPRSSDATRPSRSGVHAGDFVKPLYTLEKLFSDKELAAATQAAQLATVKHYMVKFASDNGNEGQDTQANGQGSDTPANGENGAMEEDGPNAHSVGPTTRNVTSAAAASQGHNMTPVIPPSFLTKSMTAPPPASLKPEDSAGDLAEIRRLANGGAPSSYIAVNGTVGRSGTPNVRSLSGLGGAAMSRTENLSTMSSRRGGLGKEKDDDDSASASGKKSNLGLGITSAGLERKASGDGSERKKQRRN